MTTARSSQIKRTIPLIITIFSLSFPAYAKYSGGTGEPDDPYQIATAEDLMLLGDSPEDYDKHFILTADIDLDPNLPGRKVFNEAVIGGIYGRDYFRGVFNGNDHVIRNLHIEGTNYLGLFGYIESGAKIANLGLEAVNVNGTGGSVGGLVGCNYRANITTSYSTGIVDVNEDVGGLVGLNYGTITDSYSSSHVLGTGERIGGLVGLNYGEISKCYTDGDVSGDTEVGGFVGWNDGYIVDCSAGGDVQGSNKAGGLVGLNGGVLISCCSIGSVSGNEYIGGLIGQNGLSRGCIVSSGVMYNCYSTGSVSGQNYIGGLVGADKHGGFFFDCYAAGSVSGNEYVGGLVGLSNRGEFSNSFWDTQATGQITSAGGTGKTTVQMQDPNTFMDAGWDFVNESDGPSDIWAKPVGGGYPILWWQLTPLPELPIFLGGNGEPNDPYLIATADELNSIGYNPRLMDAHFKLIDDIDLSGINFFIIGKGVFAFSGVFDGNGKKILNFSYNSTDRNSIGLFGSVRGVIKKLGLINPNVNAGTGNYIGSLAGSCSTIFHCYVLGGNVSGGMYVGGLVGGGASYYTTISNCYAEGTSVSGGEYVGGLTGKSYATITNCYSINNVSGDSRVGGLAGMTQGLILNCYSAGIVTGTTNTGGLIGNNRGIVRGSYWDIETSGQSSSAGGTGKTTQEMQRANTFVGWGYDHSWMIDDGADYPKLAWQNMSGETIPNPSYGGGSGTEEDPYLIYTAEQFNWISLVPGDWDKIFKMMADIDFNELIGTNYSTIGYYSIPHIKPFSGVFDGNGHTISNFSYNSEYIDCLGLFSIVDGENAQIKNLGLIAPDINADTQRTGAIVGWMKRGYIIGCYVIDGNITGDFVVGGFVGSNSGTITDSYALSTISGIRFVGGFSGINTGTISNCYANSSVLCPVVSSGWSGFGGLVGQNDGLVTNCYVIGDVSATRGYIGGLIGRNHNSITNCYAIGNVSGEGDVGGLLGLNSGLITNCYSAGNVTGTNNIGGLVGNGNPDRVISSFWDIETSGRATSDGGTGKTTAEMQTAGTFLGAGWDFMDETDNGTEDIWWIDEGRGYPHLWWELIHPIQQ
jgi:hypothetical protein